MSAATAPSTTSVPVRADALVGCGATQRLGRSGSLGFLALLLVFTKLIQPSYGVAGIQGLAISVLPLALAAVGAGDRGHLRRDRPLDRRDDGPDERRLGLAHEGPDRGVRVAVVLGVLLLGLVLGAINGGVVVLTRVPDIVVTLAMSFVWAGCALLVLKTPGGAAAEVAQGPGHRVRSVNEWIPKAAVVLIIVVALIWIPIRRSRLGLSIYAIGSNRLAAFRSGVSGRPDQVVAYMLTGLFAALARPGADGEHRDRRRRCPGPTRC